MSCRFRKCLGPFKMLTVKGCSKMGLLRHFNCLQPFSIFTVEGCSEMGLLRHLPNRVSPSVSFQIYKSYYDHRFFFWFKNKFKFREYRKKFRKRVCVSDNCIWIGCGKLSLLRREYFSSAVNVLINSLNI